MSSLLSRLKKDDSVNEKDETKGFIYFWEDIGEEQFYLQKSDIKKIIKKNRIALIHLSIGLLAILVILSSFIDNSIIFLINSSILFGIIVFSYFIMNRYYQIPLNRLENSINKFNAHEFSFDDEFVLYKSSIPVLMNLEEYRLGMVDFIKNANTDMKQLGNNLLSLDNEHSNLKMLVDKINIDLDRSMGSTVNFQEIKAYLNRVSQGIDSFISTFDETLIGISDISNVLKSIGKQITMLALNAGIEAARAGEKGIGFEIVALNLRRLAFHTTNSTSGIKDLIKNINTGAKKEIELITESMNDLSGQLDKSHRALRNIQNDFNQFKNNLDKMNEDNREVETLIRKQTLSFQKFII